MSKIKGEKLKTGLRRGAWLFMALLFLVSAVGVSVAIFWQATRPPDQSPQDSNNLLCQIQLTQGQETIKPPTEYKSDKAVTQLQTTDLDTGTGEAVKAGDCLSVKYYGTLASNGKLFDENFTSSQALKFELGSGQVIPGWDEGLVGMKVGGMRRLVIPSELAYGNQSVGEIPANSDLVFTVKLLAAQ